MGDGEFDSLAAAEDAGAAGIKWGVFIDALIAFLIVAWILFIIVRNMNELKKEEEAAPAEPAGPTQEELLGEIRDLLAKS